MLLGTRDPVLDDEGMQKKKPLNILFSLPVASTFTPSKGKAEGVDKAKQEHIFTNYYNLVWKLQNIKCGIICQSGAQ
jgi:hypothetical protein